MEARARRVRQHLELVPVVLGGRLAGTGFGTLKARSSSQTRCHFGSISWGSYLGVVIEMSSGTKKPLRREAVGRLAQRRRACLPGLGKKQLLHWDPDTSNVLELFPETARIEDGELTLGGVRASRAGGRSSGRRCSSTARTRSAARLRAYREAAPGALVVYGTKAFANVALLRLLAEEGVGADVSTLGELAFAQAAGDSRRAARLPRQQQVGRGAARRGRGGRARRARRAGRGGGGGRGRREARARAPDAGRRGGHAPLDPDGARGVEVRPRARRRRARDRARARSSGSRSRASTSTSARSSRGRRERARARARPRVPSSGALDAALSSTSAAGSASGTTATSSCPRWPSSSSRSSSGCRTA